jgi:23S rRNA (cytosine1962-C5)-methyltransferase
VKDRRHRKAAPPETASVRRRSPGKSNTGAKPGQTAILRKDVVRIPPDIAARVRAGHPWIFRDALGLRSPNVAAGTVIEVTDTRGAFVAWALFDPDGPIALRVATRREAERPVGDYFARVVAAAQARRARLLPGIAGGELSAYRVLSGDSEGFPGAAVERYGDYLVVQHYTAASVALREPLYDALEAALRPRAIYEQHRQRPLSGEGPRPPAVLARGELAPPDVEVREGDARFLVDVTAPQNVGLFCDLREGRAVVRALARDQRVLNLFSFTGAFSVYAALGGASEVASIDLAAKGHARARQNFERSGLDPERGQEYYAEDVFKMLAKLESRGRKFDVVVCDPPTFSQAKGRVFAALKDWAELGHAVLSVLEPGGVFMACSNTAKLAADDLERALGEGATRAGTRLVVARRVGLPPDYPVAAGFGDGHYLKCAVTVRD